VGKSKFVLETRIFERQFALKNTRRRFAALNSGQVSNGFFTMRTSILASFLALLFALPAFAQTAPGSTTASAHGNEPVTARVELPALDLAKLAQTDAGNDSNKSVPYRYAVPVTLNAAQAKAASLDNGNWSTDKTGDAIWRTEIYAAGASSVDVLLQPFSLPHGAELWARSADGGTLWGPYTDENNNARETLPLPVVPGALMRLELRVPPAQKQYVRLQVSAVNHGYRGFAFENGQVVPKASGGCNVDTICPEGNAYRQQSRAVIRYSVSGSLCTGTLITNTRNDRAPLMLTANHCLSAQASASSVVAYYNYESPVCRARTGSTVTPVPIPTSTQSGASLLATTRRSDFTLLQFNNQVPASANAFWDGWDRRDFAPASVAVIHHPQGDEKRISFENDPTTVITAQQTIQSIVLEAGAGLKIANWDLGTTEGGSSGSALLTQDTKRIVGTLSGGSALCSGTTNNGQEDYFGRLFSGWEGAGTASSRLKDHLDPIGTAVQFMDGTETCAAPTVVLSGPTSLAAGSDASFSATASGGSGSYTYEWDLDGDSVFDRKASSGQITTRYDRARLNQNVTVKVTDASGCSKTTAQAINVSAPNLRFVPAGTLPLEQICGNGNGAFDPGERWRLKMNLTNAGAAAAQNGYAQFTSASRVASFSAADTFGYKYADSLSAPAACTDAYISANLDILRVNAGSTQVGVRVNDEGISDALVVDSFSFYGQPITSVALSTNGYVVLNPLASANGNDYTPDCSNRPARDSGSTRRLRPLNADLEAQQLRAGRFNSCPRTSTIGSAGQACLVFEWRNVDFLTPGTTTLSGQSNFDMQAIVYPATGQIVYQYRNNLNAAQANTAVVGLMNTTNAFNYQCNSGPSAGVRAGKAICFYQPGNLPASNDVPAIAFSQSASSLGNVAAGANVQAVAEFGFDKSLGCGQRSIITLQATGDDRSIAPQAQDVQVDIGASCTPVSNCALPAAPAMKGGSYFNPNRSGNGLVAFIITRAAPQLPLYFGAWFTGEADRDPVWYILQGDLVGNQVNAPILKVTRNAGAAFSVTSASIGQAQVSLIDDERIFLTYQFDASAGQGSAGGELMQRLLKGVPANVPNNTGHYFSSGESGWGQTYESFVANGAAQEFLLSYLYDATGQPRWTLAQEPITASSYPTSIYQVHCPTCAWLDISPTKIQVGTSTRSFPNGFGLATIGTNLTFPAPYGGSWLRNNLTIQPISQNPGN
jgi:lysyl endopeptidase